MMLRDMDAARFWVGLLVVAFSVGAWLFWFSIHPFVGFWRRVGFVGTLALHYALMLAVAGGAIVFRDAVMFGDYGTNWWLVGVAVPLLVVSGVIRYYQMRELDNKTLTGLPELAPERFDSHLITSGIYARVRHPRYVQLALALVAYALFVNYLIGYLGMVVGLIALLVVTRIEERELLDRFGEAYRRYMNEVPRYLPRWPGAARS
jgi:protein-S-isoprenylcysteine O-methyltransferase Ste14